MAEVNVTPTHSCKPVSFFSPSLAFPLTPLPLLQHYTYLFTIELPYASAFPSSPCTPYCPPLFPYNPALQPLMQPIFNFTVRVRSCAALEAATLVVYSTGSYVIIKTLARHPSGSWQLAVEKPLWLAKTQRLPLTATAAASACTSSAVYAARGWPGGHPPLIPVAASAAIHLHGA